MALISVLLWAMFAGLAFQVRHIPPFLLLSLTMGLGCLPSILKIKTWFERPWTLLFGTGCLFGYHFLLFVSMRLAPPIEANLINYTWPILMVFFSTLLLPGYRLKFGHIIGGFLAISGAVIIVSGGHLAFKSEYGLGYLLAFGASLSWAFYSVMTKKIKPFPTSCVGGFCFITALLSLLMHFLIEPPVGLEIHDWFYLAILGIGPMGIAFYTWDAAIKKGDPRKIASLSYVIPLLSTLFLAWIQGLGGLTWLQGLALVLIVGGAVVSASCDLLEEVS